MKNKKLSSLVDEYYLSFDFKSLRDKTKEQYQYFLGVLLDTKIDDVLNIPFTACDAEGGVPPAAVPDPVAKPLSTKGVADEKVVVPATVPPSVRFKKLSNILLKSLFPDFKKDIPFVAILFFFYNRL